MLDVKKIKNYTEPMWFLGTDILEEQDLNPNNRSPLPKGRG